MPNFTFTGPQGQQITVSGPDGSTPAQAFQIMQQHLGQGNNPAQTKVPGYQASDTGQFTPIQNAGQQAQAPTGNAALGALQGLSNSVLGAGNSMAAGAYAALTPHSNMGEASQNFDTANKFLQGNQIGTPTAPSANINNTDAARQAVQGAATTVAGAPQTLFDAGANKLNAFAQKLPWAPAVNQFINQHPVLQKFQAATQAAGDIAANTVLPAIAGKTAGLARTGIDAATADTPFSTARQLKLSIPPSFAKTSGGKASISPVIEGMEGGSPKTAIEASVKNQPAINAAAAADHPTIPEGAELTPETLDAAKAPYEATYQKVAALGNVDVDPQYAKDINAIAPNLGRSFPKAQTQGVNADIAELKDTYSEPNFNTADALQHIKELRDNARANYQAASNPSGKNANSLTRLADAQNQVSDALLNQIDRWAESRPEGFEQSGLGKEFRNARQGLAKLYTLEDAIKPGTTDVSAAILNKMVNKGKPLTGNMQKIGELYNTFGPAMRDAGPLRNKVPINRLEGMLGGVGAGVSVVKGSGPGLAASAAYLGAPIVARKIMLSNAFQNSMLPKEPMDPMMMRLLMGGAPAALNAQNQVNPLLQGNKQ